MSTVSVTQAMTFRVASFGERFGEITQGARGQKTVAVMLTGPLAHRWHGAASVLLEVVQTRVVAAVGAAYLDYALTFTNNAAFYVLMALLGQTWEKPNGLQTIGPATALVGGRRDDAAANAGIAGRYIEENIAALGKQVALLPGTLHMQKVGAWGAPGSRLDVGFKSFPDQTILRAWNTFVRDTKGSEGPRWLA